MTKLIKPKSAKMTNEKTKMQAKPLWSLLSRRSVDVLMKLAEQEPQNCETAL
jgi:hypothetical protein